MKLWIRNNHNKLSNTEHDHAVWALRQATQEMEGLGKFYKNLEDNNALPEPSPDLNMVINTPVPSVYQTKESLYIIMRDYFRDMAEYNKVKDCETQFMMQKTRSTAIVERIVKAVDKRIERCRHFESATKGYPATEQTNLEDVQNMCVNSMFLIRLLMQLI